MTKSVSWLPITKEHIEQDKLDEMENNEKDRKLPDLTTLKDPQLFFEWFGGLLHPKLRDENGYPVKVVKLAWYQDKFARMKRAVMLKNNKAGVTSSEAICGDFRTRLLPESAGFDCLLVGQNQFMADQHLLDLKRDILNSENAKGWMITNPQKLGLKEEKSKSRMLYIHNPYNPKKPSRIIAIGFSEALAYSWKNVNRLHISDPGQNTRKNQVQFFSGLYSRLSNTEGEIKIEGVAGERNGYFYNLCRKLFHLEDKYQDEQDFLDPERELIADKEVQSMETSFETIEIDADDSVEAGIISREWLEYMKGVLSHDEFMRIYYHVFSNPEGAIFGDWKFGDHESLGLEK